ncbi:MAG TPA: RAMP superfamily CRISPR-associated protein [Herpetosiphonaceae bacterium]
MSGDRDRREPPAPKPYTLIDLPHGAPVERRSPIGHDALRQDLLAGWIDLELEALTPVHVATGLLKLVDGSDGTLARALVRVGGTPVIPGSSLKGCIRAIVEAISASCVRVTRSRDLPSALAPCSDKDQLCLACRIFGAMDFQGLVRFGDLRLAQGDVAVAEVPQLFQPRPREGPYVRERFVRGRKFYMHGAEQARGDGPIEVCVAGSRFRGRIHVINMSAAQLGLLLTALGLHPSYPLRPKLGGAKPACYGSIAARVLALDLAAPQARYLDWDAPTQPSVAVEELIAAAAALVLPPQAAALAETLRWPNERTCPSGNY